MKLVKCISNSKNGYIMIVYGENSPFSLWRVADKARALFVARTVAGRGAEVPKQRPADPRVPVEKRNRKCDTE